MANHTQSLAMIQGPYDCSSKIAIWLSYKLVKDYVIVERIYDHCNFITTISECEAAAQYLGLSDTSATTVNNKGNGDPPYCYYEGGNLQLNGDGTSTGGCGDLRHGYGNLFDRCLCKSSICTGGMHTTTTATTTSTETTSIISSSGNMYRDGLKYASQVL